MRLLITIFFLAVASMNASGAEVGRNSEVPLIGAGDKLKMIFYGRTDISGDYTVQVGGTLSIPLLGAFEAEGKTLAELSEEILKSFVRDRQEPAQLVVEVAEWRPIYLMGLVDKPGEYPFKPGLTALQAVASAGGLYRSSTSGGVFFQVVRETSRVSEAKKQLERARAQKLRLQAELTNAELAAAPDDAAAGESAVLAMEEQARALDWSRKSLRSKVESKRKEIALSASEVQSYRRQLEEIEQQIKLTGAMLTESQGLADRGLTPRLRVVEIQRIVASLRAEREQVNASLYRAERSKIQSVQEQDTLEIDHNLLVQQAMGVVEDKIATLEAELRTAQFITDTVPGAVGESREDVAVRIVRQGNSQSYSLAKAERVPLMPGDLLLVEVDAEEGDKKSLRETSQAVTGSVQSR